MPGAESISTVPPRSVDDAVHGGQPEAGALAASLVVKNGSKARSRTSSGMPAPSSATVIRTPPASTSPAGRPLTAIASVPPSGIASRALTARLTSTCSSWARSTWTGTSPGPTVSRSAMRSLSVRSQQALEVADERAPTSSDLWLDDLAAAEHEQLARERRGALGRAPDLVDVVAHRVVGGQLRAWRSRRR